MIVADSDVLIDSLRGKDPARTRVAAEIRAGRLATTVVSAFELLSGARTEDERTRVDTLLGALLIFPIDEPASREAAAVRRELEPQGKGIGMADYLIAGICIARAASLLTRNRAHFERVPGLKLEGLS